MKAPRQVQWHHRGDGRPPAPSITVTALAPAGSASPGPSAADPGSGSPSTSADDGHVIGLAVVAGLVVLLAVGVVYLGVRER